MQLFHTTSAGARVSASETLSHITSAKFESWKATTESLILNWQDQVRMHESLVNSDSYFSVNQNKMLLENIVNLVKPLCAVKCQANKLHTHR